MTEYLSWPIERLYEAARLVAQTAEEMTEINRNMDKENDYTKKVFLADFIQRKSINQPEKTAVMETIVFSCEFS